MRCWTGCVAVMVENRLVVSTHSFQLTTESCLTDRLKLRNGRVIFVMVINLGNVSRIFKQGEISDYYSVTKCCVMMQMFFPCVIRYPFNHLTSDHSLSLT